MTAPARVDLSRVEFLVVDDNWFVRRLLREVLRSFGAGSVREAGDVAQALEEIDRKAPDIILCDWMMRPMDGLALLNALRLERGSRIPVIMVTGHATDDHVAAALGSGADSYIVKPFRIDTLLDHILKVIETSGGNSGITFV